MTMWRVLLGIAAMWSWAPVWSADRVVTLSPHLAELVCAAGACDQLVGVVKYSDEPAAVAKLPRVGDAFAVNAEAVLGLSPTVVLSWDGGTPVQTVAQLEHLRLKVVPIRVRTLDDIGGAVQQIGTLLGTPDVAATAVADYHRRLVALRTRYAGATPLRVFYQLEAEPMFTINRDSPMSEAIGVCGGANLFADQARLAGAVSREAVIARDPDAIVFGSEDDVDGIRSRWQRVPSVRAVKAGNLLTVQGDRLARATPRMIDGIEDLCGVLDRARANLKP